MTPVPEPLPFEVDVCGREDGSTPFLYESSPRDLSLDDMEARALTIDQYVAVARITNLYRAGNLKTDEQWESALSADGLDVVKSADLAAFLAWQRGPERAAFVRETAARILAGMYASGDWRDVSVNAALESAEKLASAVFGGKA